MTHKNNTLIPFIPAYRKKKKIQRCNMWMRLRQKVAERFLRSSYDDFDVIKKKNAAKAYFDSKWKIFMLPCNTRTRTRARTRTRR